MRHRRPLIAIALVASAVFAADAGAALCFTVSGTSGKKNVTSFSAKIDGKEYAFPKDACAKK